jgi:TniQ protein
MTTWTDVRRPGKLRPLPRGVSPVQDETTASYVHRLALANHIDDRELYCHLNPRLAGSQGLHRRRETSLEALAAVSAISAIHLAHALPEIRSQFTDQDALHVLGRTTVKGPNVERVACRRCIATKNITTGSVIVWARQDQNVCLRHKLWIGKGVRKPEDQVDIADLPEITRAQVRHNNLIRRHGRRRVRYFQHTAEEIIDWSSNNPYSATARSTRMRYFFAQERADRLPWSYDYAAYYPEAVSVLSVLASPYWRRLAISGDPAENARFYRHVAANGLTNGTPAENTPLIKWLEHQRLDRTLDDPDGEEYMRLMLFGQSGVIDPADPDPTDTTTWLKMMRMTDRHASHSS